jgi:hypothetical protein
MHFIIYFKHHTVSEFVGVAHPFTDHFQRHDWDILNSHFGARVSPNIGIFREAVCCSGEQVGPDVVLYTCI